MNETHGARHGHPEPAEIAALDEDLLSPAEAGQLRQHLARCSACAGVQAELAALRDALGDLPDPGPLPEDVAARIDAALAAEATRTVSRETPTVPQQDWRERRWFRRLQVALAACGAALALVGGLTVLQTTGSSSQDDAGGGAEAADEALAEGSEPLESQVRELLAEAEETNPLITQGDAGTEAATPQSGDDASPAEAVPEVPACVENAIGRHEAPLAADEEDYAGVEAYLVVFPHEVDPDQVDAYVVTASCATSAPAASGEILVQESYPRD